VDTPLEIVVIEDHILLQKVTVQLLESRGHRVVGLSCSEEIDDGLGVMVPDLYIVDLNLPGEDGLSLARRLRVAQPDVGIIMVTARDSLDDRLNGYESGADIYLPKPADPAELLAAVNALARRLRPAEREDCVVDTQNQRIKGPKGVESLQHHEARLLSALARAPGKTLEFWQVAQQLGQSEDGFSKASMEVRVARLRRKLADVSGVENPIRSLRKTGYRLCVPVVVD
jgi:DNA-binding response OmpR family regulator